MSDLTDTRGADYGPPWEHHSKTAALVDILLDGKAPATAIQWQACMVLDKLVRLSHSWSHRDSIADIGGYAECMAMTVDQPDLTARTGCYTVTAENDGERGVGQRSCIMCRFQEVPWDKHPCSDGCFDVPAVRKHWEPKR